MKTLQIPDNELNEMKQFYLEEYEKANARILHITQVLNRLNVEIPAGVAFEPPLKGTAGIISDPLKKEIGTKKKPGKKSKWELMVMKRMRQMDKPVTYDQLTDEIMSFNKISPQKRTSTKQAVVNVVFRLRNRDHKLDTFSMGTREKYIALKNWFDSPGKIRKEYAAKVEIPGRPKRTKKGKVGRPRKTPA
ncbi:MAG: hypothetical protein R6W31_19280 [Bacteroidales bacterium]